MWPNKQQQIPIEAWEASKVESKKRCVTIQDIGTKLLTIITHHAQRQESMDTCPSPTTVFISSPLSDVETFSLCFLMSKAKCTWSAVCLWTDGPDSGVAVEEEEVRDYRVKCLNNLATAQLKLEQYEQALHTSRDVLTLEPNNVKALFRMGKVRSNWELLYWFLSIHKL